MKPFPDNVVANGTVASPARLSGNVRRAYEQANGGIDPEQLPVKEVTEAVLALPAKTDISAGSNAAWRIDMPTQTFARVTTGTNTGTPWTPTFTIDPSTDDWGVGWNFIEQYRPSLYLEQAFPAEGALVGHAVIDWHRGAQRFNNGTADAWWGTHWWIRWGVFVNGVLVAETGELYPQRQATTIPFSVPSPGGVVRVQVAFRLLSDWSPAVTFDTSTDLDIFLVDIIVRHVAR